MVLIELLLNYLTRVRALVASERVVNVHYTREKKDLSTFSTIVRARVLYAHAHAHTPETTISRVLQVKRAAAEKVKKFSAIENNKVAPVSSALTHSLTQHTHETHAQVNYNQDKMATLRLIKQSSATMILLLSLYLVILQASSEQQELLGK